MTQTSYEAILKGSWDDVPEPQDLPVGGWVLDCKSAKVQPPRQGQDYPVALFSYEPIEPCDDVSEEELRALGEGYEFASNTLYKRFQLRNAKDWNRVREHIKAHGVNVKDYGSVEESLDACKNVRVTAYLQHRHYTTKAGEARTEMDLINFMEQE